MIRKVIAWLFVSEQDRLDVAVVRGRYDTLQQSDWK
jgi:hypothetical protein